MKLLWVADSIACVICSYVLWSVHLPTKLHMACCNGLLVIIYVSMVKINIWIATGLSFSIFKNTKIIMYVPMSITHTPLHNLKVSVAIVVSI